MNHWLVGAILTLVCGIAVSYLNYGISLFIMRKKPDIYPMISVFRQIVNVAYLAAVYFLAPYTPWDLLPLLIGAALGTTLSIFFFTYLLVKKTGGTVRETETRTKTISEKGDE